MKRHSPTKEPGLEPSEAPNLDEPATGWLAQCQNQLGNAAMVEMFRERQTNEDGEGSAGEAPSGWGQSIDSHRGVTAYSNGGNLGTCVPGEFGYMYQCVEYVNRFAVEVLGLGNMKGTGNARDYTSARAGLEFVPNTPGPALPQDGDILVFDGGENGHVAICTDSSEGRVGMIQQNTNSARDVLPVLGEAGGYTVGAWGGYQLMGWQTTGQTLDPAQEEAIAVDEAIRAGLTTGESEQPAANGDPQTGSADGSGDQRSTRVVRPGDTLWGIAAELLGDGARYMELYEANREVVGPDPNLIFPGQVLQWPG